MSRLRIETAPQITVYDESVVFKAAAGATANLLEIKNSSDTVVASIAVSGSTSISGDLTVSGNMTVSGSSTTVNTETLTINDNIIVLNNNASGAPSENAGIEVERGSSDNVSIRWNETADTWQLTNDGTTFADVQASITAGAGLSKSANTINVVSASSSRINVSAGNIDLATVAQSNTSGESGVSFIQSHSVDAYGRIDGTVTASVRDATTTLKGIAIFDAADFDVTAGVATIKASGVDNAQLANSSLTINGTSVNLGSTGTVSAAAATLTGTGLAATVISSSLTSVGTITSGTWNGTAVGIAYGGTGQSTASTAINALLPSQTSEANKYLTTNGTATNWGAIELAHINGVTTSSTELNYVDGVTSAIQTQLDTKAPLASPTFTGTPTIPTGTIATTQTAGNNTTAVATTAFVTDAVATGVASATVDNLNDVSDVTITSAATGDLLKWNGTAWVNAAGYALLASPELTGTPTAPTAAAATNTTQVATTAFVRTEVSNLVGSAGATLDTLGEIATALGNDVALSTTLTTSIGLKAPLASPTFTGTVTIPTGGVITSPSLTVSTTTSTTSARLAYDSTSLKLLVGDGTTAREYASSTVITNTQTASYTAVIADKDKLVEMNNASANNLTVPPNSSVAFAVGAQIRILQIGAGQTTVVAGAGVTINSTPGLKLRAQWSSATLIKRATDTWVLIGDLAA